MTQTIDNPWTTPRGVSKAEVPPKYESVKQTWLKVYNMALKRFKNDEAKAKQAANNAAQKVLDKKGGSSSSTNGSSGSSKPTKGTNPFATKKDVEIRVEKIEGSSVDPNYFFGWGYVSERGGEPITDVSGQRVSVETLEDSFYKMMLDYRSGREMHKEGGDDPATIVEGVVFTPEKCEAMGMAKNASGGHDVPYGAWLGFYVHDDAVRQKIVSGEYPALSIGGTARERQLGGDTPLGKADWTPDLHPRDTSGKFRDKVGGLVAGLLSELSGGSDGGGDSGGTSGSARPTIGVDSPVDVTTNPTPDGGEEGLAKFRGQGGSETGAARWRKDRSGRITDASYGARDIGQFNADDDDLRTLNTAADERDLLETLDLMVADKRASMGAQERMADRALAARKVLQKAGSYSDLDRGARDYLKMVGEVVRFAKPELGGRSRHGPSIKCPDIYEALKREGKTKTRAAKISNECSNDPTCNCH